MGCARVVGARLCARPSAYSARARAPAVRARPVGVETCSGWGSVRIAVGGCATHAHAGGARGCACAFEWSAYTSAFISQPCSSLHLISISIRLGLVLIPRTTTSELQLCADIINIPACALTLLLLFLLGININNTDDAQLLLRRQQHRDLVQPEPKREPECDAGAGE
ncbi:hypothetical protein B0H13DRAFT_2332000 [Mycena leptocephala]|nr:hypothetical protein B0H13DRAFT_2332000 [Mycena leptocephala]